MAKSQWPGLSGRPAAPADFPTPTDDYGYDDVEEVLATEEPVRERRKVVAPIVRGIASVVSAVYAALADPLTNLDDEAREQRAQRVRRAGIVAASAATVAVLIYAIFPVRTYLDLRTATKSAQERRDVFTEQNESLEKRAEELRSRDVIEEIARRDYGLVFPGEESYGVLPPPAPTTTTTTPP